MGTMNERFAILTFDDPEDSDPPVLMGLLRPSPTFEPPPEPYISNGDGPPDVDTLIWRLSHLLSVPSVVLTPDVDEAAVRAAMADLLDNMLSHLCGLADAMDSHPSRLRALIEGRR
jgi:hypothetical protein